MPTTSRWILLITEDNQQKLVLLYRKKNGNEYYIFPWGHVEDGETPEQTLIREIKEELSIDITISKLLKEYENTDLEKYEYFYLCEHIWWKLAPGTWPEREKNSDENFYQIVTIPINELTDYNVLPAKMKELVIKEYS
jgi:8-oxo-dGTP pyrophosphatase MutT (NUDIX family)